MKTLVITITVPDNVLDVTLKQYAEILQEESHDDAEWDGDPPWLIQHHTIRPATEQEAEAFAALAGE